MMMLKELVFYIGKRTNIIFCRLFYQKYVFLRKWVSVFRNAIHKLFAQLLLLIYVIFARVKVCVSWVTLPEGIFISNDITLTLTDTAAK